MQTNTILRFASEREALAFLDAVITAVGDRPKLVSDVLGNLRDKGWKIGGDLGNFHDYLKAQGFFIRGRRHGAGWADYVATADFKTIIDGRGKEREVQ